MDREFVHFMLEAVASEVEKLENPSEENVRLVLESVTSDFDLPEALRFFEVCLACGLIYKAAYQHTCCVSKNLHSAAEMSANPNELPFTDAVIEYYRSGQVEVAKRLLLDGFKDESYREIMLVCVRSGCVELVSFLISMNLPFSFADSIKSLIFEAIEHKRVAVLRFLLEGIEPKMWCHPSIFLSKTVKRTRERHTPLIFTYLEMYENRLKALAYQKFNDHLDAYELIRIDPAHYEPVSSVENSSCPIENLINLATDHKFKEVKCFLKRAKPNYIEIALCSFIRLGIFEMVIFCIERFKMNTAFDQEFYLDALKTAYSEGRFKVSKYLVKVAPLHVASFNFSAVY